MSLLFVESFFSSWILSFVSTSKRSCSFWPKALIEKENINKT